MIDRHVMQPELVPLLRADAQDGRGSPKVKRTFGLLRDDRLVILLGILFPRF